MTYEISLKITAEIGASDGSAVCYPGQSQYLLPSYPGTLAQLNQVNFLCLHLEFFGGYIYLR